MPSASIIIPTCNRANWLRIALLTVAEVSVPEGWRAEVLVIDNNSSDDTATVVQSLRDGFPLPLRRVVEARQGLNHARNRGMQEAAGDWLVYLDDDIKVTPGWLNGLAEAIHLFSPQIVTGPVVPWFEGEVPSWCVGKILDSVTSAYSRKGERPILLAPEQGNELPGCNFAVLRALAYELGGFHPALDRVGDSMLAGGDTEFGQRAAKFGACSVYNPQCQVEHLISRHKVSKAGLKARWHGAGATRRALRRLEGVEPSSRSASLFFLSMIRDFVHSRLFRLLGRDSRSFQCELTALYIKGYLFGAPALYAKDLPRLTSRPDAV